MVWHCVDLGRDGRERERERKRERKTERGRERRERGRERERKREPNNETTRQTNTKENTNLHLQCIPHVHYGIRTCRNKTRTTYMVPRANTYPHNPNMRVHKFRLYTPCCTYSVVYTVYYAEVNTTKTNGATQYVRSNVNYVSI